jgi:hypothetical protein
MSNCRNTQKFNKNEKFPEVQPPSPLIPNYLHLQRTKKSIKFCSLPRSPRKIRLVPLIYLKRTIHISLNETNSHKITQHLITTYQNIPKSKASQKQYPLFFYFFFFFTVDCSLCAKIF